MYLNRYPHPPCAVREDCVSALREDPARGAPAVFWKTARKSIPGNLGANLVWVERRVPRRSGQGAQIVMCLSGSPWMETRPHALGASKAPFCIRKHLQSASQIARSVAEGEDPMNAHFRTFSAMSGNAPIGTLKYMEGRLLAVFEGASGLKPFWVAQFLKRIQA